MKTYKNLWIEMLKEENINRAIDTALKGKSSRKKKDRIRRISENREKYIPIIRKEVESGRMREHKPVYIYDGIRRKRRKIIVPNEVEQIIHHLTVHTLQPIVQKGMYEHAYGSIPGRGAHKGKKTIERWGMTKYVLKMDIKKYFDSVDQEVLIAKLRKKIRDEKMMEYLEAIIHATPNGIPLGFFTSQWFANFYLQDLDHYITEHLRAGKYIRYMDDMVIFSNNKKKLHRARKVIEQYLSKELNLKLKENWQVFRTPFVKDGRECGRALDFMGFKFYRSRTTLRRSIYYRTCRKAEKISRKGKTTWYDAAQMLSYVGWFDCTDTYGTFEKHIKPKVNIRNLKRIISRKEKRDESSKHGISEAV